MDKEAIKYFFTGGGIGMAPVQFAVFCTLFIVVGAIVIADGHPGAGIGILAFGAFAGLLTALRQRRRRRP